MERAIVFEENEALVFEHLQLAGAPGAVMQPNDWFNPNFRFPAEGFDLEEAIARLIEHALKQTNRNVSAAARLLGVSRDYLRYRLSGQKAALETGE